MTRTTTLDTARMKDLKAIWDVVCGWSVYTTGFRMKFSKLLGWERLQKIIKTKLNRRVDEAEVEDPEAEAE